MRDLKGFSLIELMVVIAIIGVLASIAVPAYKNYVMKQRLSIVVPYVNMIMDRSISFAMTNGRFGNAYDIGLSATAGSTTIDNVNLPYVIQGFSITDAEGNCGKSGTVVGDWDPGLIGFSSSQSTYYGAEFNCWFYHTSGVIRRYCNYHIGIYGGTIIPGDWVSGWVNSNTTSSSHTGYDTFGPTDASYSNRTCM